MLSVTSQKEKDKYCMILFSCGILKKKGKNINKHNRNRPIYIYKEKNQWEMREKGMED